MNKWAALIAGSVAGGVARYVMTGLLARHSSSFPVGTISVNLLGCFLIGVFASLSSGRFALDVESRILLMTGFCGAFTTFSTLILETSQLLREGFTGKAAAYVAVSLVAGFLLFRAGEAVGQALPGR